MSYEPTEAEIAWVAGIFEGEGCMVKHQKSSVSLRIAMTDKDVLERVAESMECGSITLSRPGTERWKPVYCWAITDAIEVRRILGLLMPWFCKRRRARAEEMLQRLNDAGTIADKHKTHCPKGHPYSAHNTYRHRGRRVCKTCSRRRHAEAERRKRRGVSKQQEMLF